MPLRADTRARAHPAERAGCWQDEPVTALSAFARLLLAAGVLVACSALAATAAAAEPAEPHAGAAAVSVRNCAAAGGSAWAAAREQRWCVGGVYTGIPLG